MNQTLPRRFAIGMGILGGIFLVVTLVSCIRDGFDAKLVLSAFPMEVSGLLAVIGWRREKNWMIFTAALVFVIGAFVLSA
ncbi:hypothetical protein ACIQNI_24495 [Streptomyces sp. NPDC091266]|uniref:hypothetical protein n=1 Tax=Streptomyces sp. NPDC091266 TaxID=3365978 RepID=UPI0037F53F55